MFAWGALSDSTIPNEIKQEFTARNAGHLENQAFDSAMNRLWGWASQHRAEAQTPIDFSEPTSRYIGRLTVRVSELADFYNTQQPLVAAFKRRGEKYFLDTDWFRAEFMSSLLSMIAPPKVSQKFERDLGKYQGKRGRLAQFVRNLHLPSFLDRFVADRSDI